VKNGAIDVDQSICGAFFGPHLQKIFLSKVSHFGPNVIDAAMQPAMSWWPPEAENHE
jgi:hypothetical protein